MAKKKVLGRGLGALIGKPAPPAGTSGVGSGGGEVARRPLEAEPAPEATAQTGPASLTPVSGYFLCPVGEINPGRLQPRKNFKETALTELCESIKEHGVIEPLIVTKSKGPGGGSGNYELIAGERRLRGAKMAGLSEVPVLLSEATDVESLEIALIENVQREDLNPIEEAEAYQRLMEFGLTQEGVAKKVGRERATVANFLRLLRLPAEVKLEVAHGALSMGHARAILSLDSAAAQKRLASKVLKKGLSVRETEALAAKGATTVEKKAAAVKSPEVIEVEDALRRTFSTKVHIKEKNGKGRIEILYYSPEERERILELLKSLS